MHARLGEKELAERNKAQALALEKAGQRKSGPAVHWVDAAQFASTVPASDAVLPPVKAPTPTVAAESAGAPKEPAHTAKKSPMPEWRPWPQRR